MIRSIALVVAASVRVSPRQSLVCLLETLGNFVGMLQPLFIAWLVTGAIQHDAGLVIRAVICFVVSLTVVGVLMIIGNNARISQYERVGFWFDTEISRLSSSIATLDHLQSAEYQDKAQTLRDHQGLLGFAFNMVLNALRMAVTGVGTLVLALTADPRMLLVVIAGIPAVIIARWTTRWQTTADDAAAQPSRHVKHLLELATQPGPGAEIRVFGLQRWLRDSTDAAARRWLDLRVDLAKRQSLLQTSTTVLFFAVAGAVLAWMLRDTVAGRVSIAEFVLAASLVTRLQMISDILQWSVRMLVRVSNDGSRFLWLRDYAADQQARHTGTLTPPRRLHAGISTIGLGYSYPGAETPTLTDLNLDLPAGAVVAVVGENGAGKSTLIGLLTGMLNPTEGKVLVDGVDLADLDQTKWRARMSGAFQDYARLELTAQQSIGIGDLAALNSEPAVNAALDRAAATDVMKALPTGLATQLGTTWPEGVELSGGQWQRLAIARGMMRDAPLLLVLDEPTAALDAGTEHALFERYADAARRAGGRGGVTLLVTHRFSTVASADLVVVLRGGRVAEVGTHAQLYAAGNHYAELYDLQARGYR
ncbi:ABC transporter ATP-binding protein [Microlunatus sp. Gsoil 973]|uniref:ABC transporter ATP-binding protein n=1 Tax=Microlunatus sp. Gsoil 973 TaxID=2672569 RepID=UPI001E444CC5|nr:ABC transporter ATP-binding protein [Microlunatus sp. Gsoil 973]